MNRDRLPGILALAVLCGCAAPSKPSAVPAAGEATLTSAQAAPVGPVVRAGKVQRAEVTEDAAAEDEATPLGAPKDPGEGVRPADRRDPSRRAGFGSSWK